MVKNALIIVTGSSRGIGESLVKLLLEEKNVVVGVSRGAGRIPESGHYHH